MTYFYLELALTLPSMLLVPLRTPNTSQRPTHTRQVPFGCKVPQIETEASSAAAQSLTSVTVTFSIAVPASSCSRRSLMHSETSRDGTLMGRTLWLAPEIQKETMGRYCAYHRIPLRRRSKLCIPLRLTRITPKTNTSLKVARRDPGNTLLHAFLAPFTVSALALEIELVCLPSQSVY